VTPRRTLPFGEKGDGTRQPTVVEKRMEGSRDVAGGFLAADGLSYRRTVGALYSFSYPPAPNKAESSLPIAREWIGFHAPATAERHLQTCL